MEAWEKLDGTNILAFWYKYKNENFLSFKTRMSPFLQDGNYGGFLSLWKEYFSKNLWISEVIMANKEYNLSFELFGSRNPITVEYKIPLEVNLLFGIRKHDHVIKPPSKLKTFYETKLPFKMNINNKLDLTELYENLRKSMSEKNKDIFTIEGMVLYSLSNEESWRQFKCKPEEIQKIHWSAGGIPKRELWNTAINSFEEGENSLEHFIDLLREEYTDQQIGRSEQKIKKIFLKANEHIQLV